MAANLIIISKVEPTNVQASCEVIRVELARKGKTNAESVAAFAIVEKAQATAQATVAELQQEQQTEILVDWFNSNRLDCIRENTRTGYAHQKTEVEVDLSISALFAYWKENASSGRLTAEAVLDWFKTSPCAAAMLNKLATSGQTAEQQTATLKQVAEKFCSCAAPVPAITSKEAEKLAPYLIGDTSQVGSTLARKLQAVIAKSKSNSLDAL